MMIRLFRHYIPKSLIILALLEAFVFISALYFGASLRHLDSLTTKLTVSQILIFSIVMLGAMTAMGLYSRNFYPGVGSTLLRLSFSFALGLSFMALLFYLYPSLFLGRGVLALTALSAFCGVVLGRLVFIRWGDAPLLQRRVLILGAGRCAFRIERLRKHAELRGLNIVGYLPLGDEHTLIPDNQILRFSGGLVDFVRLSNVDEIIVAVDDRRKTFPSEDLLACKMSGIEVIDIVTFLERQTGKIDVSGLHPSSLIFADGYVQTLVKPLSKRVFDIVISSIILVVTWPVMLITALSIWVESGFKGSIFYQQKRIGAGSKPFHIVKFRSMVEEAEPNGAQWAIENDPRVTYVGKFIRKTRIDELPQLVNVLKGNMSFVGPRPERPEFVKELVKTIPYYNLRHGLKPGITGWAQVSFPYGASEEDAEHKFQYDLYYMKNYSVFLDMMILLQTIQVILWQEGGR